MCRESRQVTCAGSSALAVRVGAPFHDQACITNAPVTRAPVRAPACEALAMPPRLARSGLERTGIDPDRLLVARAQRGDREAFEELVRRHADRVRGVVRRLSQSEDEAADVTRRRRSCARGAESARSKARRSSSRGCAGSRSTRPSAVGVASRRDGWSSRWMRRARSSPRISGTSRTRGLPAPSYGPSLSVPSGHWM